VYDDQNVVPLQSCCSCRSRSRGSRSWLLREAGQIALVIVVAGYVINLGYGFEGTGARLDELRFISPTLRESPGASPPGSIPRPNHMIPRWLTAGTAGQMAKQDHDVP
jgi:hypothetical protein